MSKAAKSTFISMGRIVSQISTAIGRLTLAISAALTAWSINGMKWPAATPATMHSASGDKIHRTRMVRWRSNPNISDALNAGRNKAQCRTDGKSHNETDGAM